MAKKCICEICTCGRHRCPHRPTNIVARGDQACLLSEYKNVYKEHPYTKPENYKPNEQYQQGGTFEDRTTQRQDFVPFPLERPFVHQAEQYVKPDGNMDTLTSYKKDYTEKYPSRAKAIRHDGMRQVPGRFEGEPTYRSDYKKWDMSGRQGPYTNQATWNPPAQRFEGQSTMQRDFRKYDAVPRISFKPNEAAKVSDVPFDDRTDYRDSYKQHELGPKFVHERELYKAPSAPFDGLSTFRRDYRGIPGGKMDSCKPDAQAFQSEAPFEDGTTNRTDFRKWPMERPFVHNQEQYVKPAGDMDMNTTHKVNFKEFPIQRPAIMRPSSAAKLKDAPFHGITNYSQDYKKWGMEGRVRPQPKADYMPNQARFEGISTQKAHYVPHHSQPARSFRPDLAAYQSDGKLDDHTMYRIDYTPKRVEVCPALSIDAPKSKFAFSELNPQGHRLYQPVYESVTALNVNGRPKQMQAVA